MEVSGQLHAMAALPGCWVAIRVDVEAVTKRKLTCLFKESNPGRPGHSLVSILSYPGSYLGAIGSQQACVHLSVVYFSNEFSRNNL